VAGIPILKRGPIGSQGHTIDDVVAMIDSGRFREALMAVLLPPSPPAPCLASRWIQCVPKVKGSWRLKRWSHQRSEPHWREQAARFLLDEGQSRTACELFEFFFRRSHLNDEHYNYFAYRFGQPRHLAALSLAGIINGPTKPLLDLGCGFGHVTRSLVPRSNGQPVFGLDSLFFTLYIAKHWIAPQAHYVCCDGEVSLPFSDGELGAVFCSDAFHDFTCKTSSIREAKRVTQGGGVIIVVSMRNSHVKHLHSCYTLPPEACADLVADWPHRIVAETRVLTNYLGGRGPDLASQVDMATLTHEPMVTIVASQDDAIFKKYERFSLWPHGEGQLAINPLYVQETADHDGWVRLRRTFPSAFYEEENEGCKAYLPETAELSPPMRIDLAANQLSSGIEQLLARCVVLGMPQRYL
jgi:SAM-dependent methyltransferase